jgi:2-iminobutanoate/2-iminopropanoate deaminase
MDKKFINPSAVAAPRGYSHAVSVEGGRMIFVAGQVAFNKEGQLVGAGDLRAQAQQAFDNLAAVLEAAGATPRDVVKTNIFIVNYKSADLAVLRQVRSGIFDREHPPASTLVGVTSLAVDGLMIEVEAIAVVR